MPLAQRTRVRIAKASAAVLDPRHDVSASNPLVDVEGYTGKVVGEPYVNERTGDEMTCVQVDHGGGIAAVPTRRLATDLGGKRSHGFSGINQEDWDRVFGRKKK